MIAIRARLAEIEAELAEMQACAWGAVAVTYEDWQPASCSDGTKVNEQTADLLKPRLYKLAQVLQKFLVDLGAVQTTTVFGERINPITGHSLRGMLRDWHLNWAYEPMGMVLRGKLWKYVGSTRQPLTEN